MKKLIFLFLAIFLFSLVSVGADSSYLASNTYSYWKLEEPSGTLAVDTVGANNGTYTGNVPNAVAGIINNGQSFDGTTDYVALLNDADFQGTTNTMVAWVKTSDAGSSYRNVFCKGSAWTITINNGVFGTYDWAGSGFKSSTVNIEDNAWHQLVFVRQVGVAGGSSLWVDGINKANFTYSSNTQTKAVAIGSSSDPMGNEAFIGIIDEVSIFNKALNGTEINFLYNTGSPGSEQQYPYTAPVTDTCTYSGSGDWNVNCADNCTISSNVNLGGNSINILGYGTFYTSANITNFNNLLIAGSSSTQRCNVVCYNGGCFK